MTFFPNRFEEYLHFFKEPVLLFTRLLTVLLDSQICSQSLVFFFSKQCFHHSILSINTLAAIQGCLKRSRCPISPQWQFWYAIFLCYIFHPQNSLWSTLMEMFSSKKKEKKKRVSCWRICIISACIIWGNFFSFTLQVLGCEMEIIVCCASARGWVKSHSVQELLIKTNAIY